MCAMSPVPYYVMPFFVIVVANPPSLPLKPITITITITIIGTYILSFECKDLLSLHSVDQNYIHKENTAVILKMFLSDNDNIMEDYEITDETNIDINAALEKEDKYNENESTAKLIWRSMPVYMDRKAKQFNIKVRIRMIKMTVKLTWRCRLSDKDKLL